MYEMIDEEEFAKKQCHENLPIRPPPPPINIPQVADVNAKAT